MPGHESTVLNKTENDLKGQLLGQVRQVSTKGGKLFDTHFTKLEICNFKNFYHKTHIFYVNHLNSTRLKIP